ncbi:MAG TPA: hypothetical protein VF062_19120 [Candidatus Limnocylindrales bacterium]
MLARILTATVIAIATTLVVAPSPAQADYIHCPPDGGPCILVPGDPGGGSGGGVGEAQCIHDGRRVPCFRPGMGWYNPVNGCYYERLSLPPTDPSWNGRDPANGPLYLYYCWSGLSGAWAPVDVVQLRDPPPGYEGLPTLDEVIVAAIANLATAPPDIGSAPAAASTGAIGLVGLPVWMWVNRTTANWGELTAFDVQSGIRVDVRANVLHVVWDMGNGTTVTCTTPGQKYHPSEKDNPSDDCGYKYLRPSREFGGLYTVRATSTWAVDWRGNGQSGRILVTGRPRDSSSISMRINELQVVVQ